MYKKIIQKMMQHTHKCMSVLKKFWYIKPAQKPLPLFMVIYKLNKQLIGKIGSSMTLEGGNSQQLPKGKYL